MTDIGRKCENCHFGIDDDDEIHCMKDGTKHDLDGKCLNHQFMDERIITQCPECGSEMTSFSDCAFRVCMDCEYVEIEPENILDGEDIYSVCDDCPNDYVVCDTVAVHLRK